MGTNNSYNENNYCSNGTDSSTNTNKKLKFSKRFYLFKNKFNNNKRQYRHAASTGSSLSASSSSLSFNTASLRKFKLKLSICGDQNCGKTSMLYAYIYNKNNFPVKYQPTVVDDHEVKTTHNGERYTLSLYDTAGQEDWETLRIMAYPDTDVIVLCFSVVRPDSMENVKTKWIPELCKYLPNTPIILVGTQSDLRGQQSNDMNNSLHNRANTLNSQNSGGSNSKGYITTKEGEELAKRIKAFKYIECSALTQQNISEVFDACIIAHKQGELPVQENCFRKLFTSCVGSRFNTCARNSNSKSVIAKYKK